MFKGKVRFRFMPIRNNYIYKEINDEYMLIPLEGDNVSVGKVLNLNEVGAFIYKTLKDKDDIEYVIHCLVEEYDVSYAIAKKDVYTFVEELKRRGIYA